MSDRNKNNHKHLTLSQRVIIEKSLEGNESFTSIARKTGKDPSTISKEIRRNLMHHVKRDCNRDIPCENRSECSVRSLCSKNGCIKLCKVCNKPNFYCTTVCSEYKEKTCGKLAKPPYVCNGCVKKISCLLKKSFYSAKYADDCYHDKLVSTREGINQAPVDIAMLDALVSPLLLKGQSIAHIYANHAAEIPCCRKTLYNYIDKSVFSARNIDLRRRVRYKVRKKSTRVSTMAKEFRIGRTYDDFQKLIKEKPDIPVVEMDTVEGSKKDSKVFLTMLFRNCSLMLIFLLEEKTQECVSRVFDWLTDELGIETFRGLFPIILTDNGTEFQGPKRLECDVYGETRTKIYYCNPNSSWQKGMIEKNHEYIRLVIPKGKNLERYTPEDAALLMNHINSEARDRLNGCTPYKLSKMLLNDQLHKALHLVEIAPDDVTLSPELLSKTIQAGDYFT
ncbi:MAG: IS30 family transposase [Ignavibacteria bacterium]|nr:IS30 family transposase [Ignavibacteria bacterium]